MTRPPPRAALCVAVFAASLASAAVGEWWPRDLRSELPADAIEALSDVIGGTDWASQTFPRAHCIQQLTEKSDARPTQIELACLTVAWALMPARDPENIDWPRYQRATTELMAANPGGGQRWRDSIALASGAVLRLRGVDRPDGRPSVDHAASVLWHMLMRLDAGDSNVLTTLNGTIAPQCRRVCLLQILDQTVRGRAALLEGDQQTAATLARQARAKWRRASRREPFAACAVAAPLARLLADTGDVTGAHEVLADGESQARRHLAPAHALLRHVLATRLVLYREQDAETLAGDVLTDWSTASDKALHAWPLTGRILQ